MHVLFAAIVLAGQQAYDPKPDVANLYAAFGMEVGPAALTSISPAAMAPAVVYSGPEVNGKRTRSGYHESSTSGVGNVQISNMGAKPDIPGQQALPWSSREDAVALANQTLAPISTGHETQVRIILRADRLDYPLYLNTGVGLRALYDYKLDGYSFLEPVVGVDLVFDRNGSLRTATRAVKFPERTSPEGPVITLNEARAAAASMLRYSTPAKGVLGWVSKKGASARLTYRLVQYPPGADNVLGALAVDVDAVTGMAKQTTGIGTEDRLTQALLP